MASLTTQDPAALACSSRNSALVPLVPPLVFQPKTKPPTPMTPSTLPKSSQVKELLEQGTFLHRALLQQLLDAVSDFVHDCGLARYNRFALPLLVFVRKCVGVSSEEFEGMVDAARLRQVLYDPQQLLQQQLSAAQVAADETAETASVVTAAGAAAPTGRPRMSITGASSTVRKAASRMGSSVVRASGNGSATGVPPPIAPIDMAMAVASKQIVEAIATARSEHSLSAGASSRVPGLARGATPQAAVGEGALEAAQEGEEADREGREEVEEGQGVVEEEALPDLGVDADGNPLSRRVREQQVEDSEWVVVAPSAEEGLED